MEWVEITGKTIDEAKELALDQLGVDADEAEFEILDEPKAGLLAACVARHECVPVCGPPPPDRRKAVVAGAPSADRRRHRVDHE